MEQQGGSRADARGISTTPPSVRLRSGRARGREGSPGLGDVWDSLNPGLWEGARPGLTACPRTGFQALVLTALLVGLGAAAGLPLGALPEMLLPLAFAATLTAFILSLLLYLKAQLAPASALAPGGSSGERGPQQGLEMKADP